MNIRPKTVRRLTILFLAMALFSGVIATWLLVSHNRLRAEIARERVDAVAAYNAKDYSTAVTLFRDYLNRSHSQDTDPEAVFGYAKSRMNTAGEGSRNLFEAIGVFERYLQMGTANDPRGQKRRLEEADEANHLLLSLYVQARYTKEAVRVANNLLAANPNDVDALENLTRALQADGKAPAALDACRKLDALIPPDLDWQMTELRLLQATGKTSEQVMARARELAAAHPDDATFQALLSWADLVYGNDPAGAKLAIEAAAKLPPGKPQTVLQIVRLLDLQQRFSQADGLLERAAAAHPGDAAVIRATVERAWQRQSPSDALDKLRHVDTKTIDPALLGYKTLAFFQTSQAAQATPLLNELGNRKDEISRAWFIALQTEFAGKAVTPSQAVRKFNESTLRDPSNPVFWFFLGQAWARQREVDQAMQAWNRAGQLAPSWALPYCLTSRSLCDAGRYPEALRASELARQRAPGTQFVETSYALAWYGLHVSGGAATTADSNALLSLLQTIQSAWKNEPSTLPQYVTTLLRRGNRDQATAALRQAMAADPAVPADVLLQLSAVSHDANLGLETELIGRAEKSHGPTAATAFAKSVLLIESGKPTEAVSSFESRCAPHASDVEWQIAAARLHDAISSPDAPRRWSALGRKFANNVQAQYAILLSPAHLKDRDLWRQTIDRLKALTGTDGLGWQLEDAQWRLAGQPTDAEVTAVVTTLQKIAAGARSMPEVHRLLAEALLRSDSTSGVSRAVGELTVAHELCPSDFQTTSKLAQLLLTQGARDRSAALVDSVAAEPGLSAPRRMWAAAMYADLGKVPEAIALLDANPTATPDPAKNALLAQLYRRAGRNPDAAAQYRKILADPSGTIESLAAGAEFFATLGQPDVAEQFLSRIQKNSPETGAVDLLRARTQQIAGQTDKAVATLTTAARNHPKAEQIWTELSGVYLRTGNLDRADRASADGIAATGGSPKLTAMRTQIARIRQLTPQAIAPLVDVISNDPLQPVVEKAMTLLIDAKNRGNSSDQVLAAIRGLADQNTGFLPLQKLLAERYTAVGRLKEATDIAARASASSPDDVDALRLLCAIQTAAGNWEPARQTALRWKQLSGPSALDADIAIALSYLRQHKPDAPAAVAQLAPYVSPDAPDATRQSALPLYCTALVAAGKSAEAETILKPLLKNSPRWQSVWLELAPLQKDEAGASSWINLFTASVNTETPAQNIALAEVWEQVASRFDSATAHRTARALLEPVIHTTPVPVRAWPAWAAINQTADNLPEAERAWREYLKAVPESPTGQNNLAYMLMLEGGTAQLTEAEQLSRSAIAKAPAISTLYDTLARVQLRAGKPDQAVKNFRAALDRNASNVDAMIGLAEILQARPQDREEARSLLTRIDSAVRDGTPIASSVRKQLDRVRSALSSSNL
jgi:tetratricopeptide (TPR) repeat protein